MARAPVWPYQVHMTFAQVLTYRSMEMGENWGLLYFVPVGVLGYFDIRLVQGICFHNAFGWRGHRDLVVVGW